MNNFIYFLTMFFFFISCTNETSLVKVKKLSDSYTNKLKLYAETGKRNKNYLFEALEISRKITILQPDEINGRLKSAIVYIKLGMDSEAIKELEHAKENVNFTPEACIMLGALYDKSGRRQEALSCFTEALSYLEKTDMNENDREMNKIFVYAFINGRDEAIKMAEKFAANKQNNPVISSFLGVIRNFERDKFLENL